MRMIDIHQHLIYGIDDGANSREKMYGMLTDAKDQGIRYVFATPHIQPGRTEFPAEYYKNTVQELNEWAAKKGLKIEVLYGAEILYTRKTLDELDTGAVPTMNGTEYVLTEFLPEVEYSELFRALREYANGGYSPILAHMERYKCLYEHTRDRIEELRSFHVRFQMNANTAVRREGVFGKGFVKKVLKNDWVDYIASDAHGRSMRPVNLLKGYKAVESQFDSEKADRLFGGNQRRDLF